MAAVSERIKYFITFFRSGRSGYKQCAVVCAQLVLSTDY